jgi:hypothetical protein
MQAIHVDIPAMSVMYPGLHFRHDDELIAELNVPALQLTQLDDRVCDAYVPCLQGVHVVAISPEKYPSAQCEQIEDMLPAEKVPLKHCKHTEEPMPLLKNPGEHCEHMDCIIAEDKYPAVHREQTDELDVEYEPLVHAVHAVDPLAEE